jgi:subtilisin family serine protease
VFIAVKGVHMKLLTPRQRQATSLIQRFLTTAAIGLLLSGCGGGTDTATNSEWRFTGSLIDGPIEGARVYLDLNGNLIQDEGEPISLPTGPDGRFNLVASGLADEAVKKAQLVAHVPDTARDKDDGGKTLLEAGRFGFTFMSPVQAFVGEGRDVEAVVSPFTTQVTHEIVQNKKPLTEAMAWVAEQQGLPADKSPMANYVARPDAQMQSKARILTITIGEASRLIGSDLEPETKFAAAINLANSITKNNKTAISSLLVQTLGTSDSANSQPTVVTVGAVLDAIKTQTHSTASTESATENTAATTPAEQATLADAIASAVDRAQTQTSNRPAFTDYVVIFKDLPGNRPDFKGLIPGGGRLKFEYQNVARGFAVSLPAAAADAFLEAINRNPNVDRVEVDRPVMLSQTVAQSNAPWGLDRLDTRSLLLDKFYNYVQTGTSVRAYVIDTGIRATHTEFSGRMLAGYSAIADGLGTDDCNGHGTHVAGTVGGTTWGVAKQSTLVPVRVLDCNGSGTLSGVIAGMDWVAGQSHRPAVVNMSLGTGASAMLDSAVAKLGSMGITPVVAAGNSSDNACNYSPAREPSAITVAATNSSDQRASFSNFGSCVDLFAPGASIQSAWITTNTASSSLSGTSMAAPHVAGHVAQILQAKPTLTTAEVTQQLLANATLNIVKSAGTGSPNRLLYSMLPIETVEPAPTPEPTPDPGDGGNTGGGTDGGETAPSITLTGAAGKVRNTWTATVTISITASSQPVSGAAASGSFSVGGTNLSCVTGATGTCAIRSGTLSNRTPSTTFTLQSVRGDQLTYTPSFADTVRVNKP